MHSNSDWERRTQYFRRNVPLPPGLALNHLQQALEGTENIFAAINGQLVQMGVPPLTQMIQRNNLSGIISNVLTSELARVSSFERVSDQAHPDLRDPDTDVGVEIKVTVRPGKGGESHNGHGGWHLIACYNLEESTGEIRFVHVMGANLIGHDQGEVDWKFLKSTNVGGMTGHIETYVTTPAGRTKLLHGSVFLDTERVPNWNRWRTSRDTPVPEFSPYYTPPTPPLGSSDSE